MRPGVSYSYRSHAGRYYQPRTRCGVLFKKVSSCSKLRFSCSQFNIPNKSEGCEGRDKMVVIAGGVKQRFCKKVGPDISSAGNIRVMFLSDEWLQRSGAVCKAECIAATPPPSSTPKVVVITGGQDSNWDSLATT